MRIAVASSADTPFAEKVGRKALSMLEVLPGLTVWQMLLKDWKGEDVNQIGPWDGILRWLKPKFCGLWNPKEVVNRNRRIWGLIQFFSALFVGHFPVHSFEGDSPEIVAPSKKNICEQQQFFSARNVIKLY